MNLTAAHWRGEAVSLKISGGAEMPRLVGGVGGLCLG